jgi:hypothetical protein
MAVLYLHSSIHFHGVMLNCLSTGTTLPFLCVTFSSSVHFGSMRFTRLVVYGFHVLRSQRDLSIPYPLSVNVMHMGRSTIAYLLGSRLLEPSPALSQVL